MFFFILLHLVRLILKNQFGVDRNSIIHSETRSLQGQKKRTLTLKGNSPKNMCCFLHFLWLICLLFNGISRYSSFVIDFIRCANKSTKKCFLFFFKTSPPFFFSDFLKITQKKIDFFIQANVK